MASIVGTGNVIKSPCGIWGVSIILFYFATLQHLPGNIDVTETETVRLHAKRSGWWVIRKSQNNTEVSEPVTPVADAPEPPTFPKPKRSLTMPFEGLARRMTFNKEKDTELDEDPVLVAAPSPAASRSFFPLRKGSLDDFKRPPLEQKSMSDSVVPRDDAPSKLHSIFNTRLSVNPSSQPQ